MKRWILGIAVLAVLAGVGKRKAALAAARLLFLAVLLAPVVGGASEAAGIIADYTDAMRLKREYTQAYYNRGTAYRDRAARYCWGGQRNFAAVGENATRSAYYVKTSRRFIIQRIVK